VLSRPVDDELSLARTSPDDDSAPDGAESSPAGETHGRRAAAWLRDSLSLALPDGLLALALTHRSWAYENGGAPTNERLEFLGDSVLGLVVTDELYRSKPSLPEGQLAKLRASVVNMTSLARVARGLGDGGLGPHLLLGRGEETTGGREKDSILADALEALIGAVHLGRGLGTAADLVHRLFDPLLAESATRGAGLDWKTSLQELAAARGLGAPSYQTEDDGPDHAKTFSAAVVLSGTVYGTGTGRTKKAAEQEAAETAWQALSADEAGGAVGAPGTDPADPRLSAAE
jgi:ribonuclease-3